MDTIDILGNHVPVAFEVGQGAQETDLDRPTLRAGAADMAALINRCALPKRYREAFRLMKKIVFFAGKVEVDGYLMDRPCCDQDDAIFYWEAKEFMHNTDADVRANTFFHDCWHVVQFKDAGNRYASGQAQQVGREVDAITHQIEVARLVGCDAREIGYLQAFQADQQRIVDRLEEGVEKMAPHATGAVTKGKR
jgi:hypothetical protein